MESQVHLNDVISTANGVAKPELPGPGIYADVPASEYHSWPFFSYSTSSALKRSPAHMKYEREHPSEQTPSMVVGEAIHMAVLQPTLFPERFAIAPKLNKRTNAGKEQFEQFQLENSNRVIIDAETAMMIERVASAVRNHPTCNKLLSAPTGVELTGVFDLKGVRCKMRSDLLSERFQTLIDLKTTTDASPEAFAKSVFNYGYHRQAALYIDGWKALGKLFKYFVIVAIEKEPPYGIALYRLDAEQIELGREENAALLSAYAECEKAKAWPSYPLTVQKLTTPSYLRKRK